MHEACEGKNGKLYVNIGCGFLSKSDTFFDADENFGGVRRHLDED